MLRVVNFGSAKGGLATVGYTVYGVDGAVIASRSTTGVHEIGTSTGIYAANITVPDYDAIVLWDTGEATPRYSTEDYQHQVTSILETVQPIQKIYNSIKNQGEFFAALMDRMGLLEKNQGLQKVNDKIDALSSREAISMSNIEEAFLKAGNSIKASIPEYPKPEYPKPDFSEITSLFDRKINGLQSEISKLPKSQKDYSVYFKTLSNHLLNISNYFSEVKTALAKFDSIVSKIDSLGQKLNSLDSNDKEFIRTKNNITDEVKRLTQFIHILSSSNVVKDFQDANNLLMSFGHKR